MQNGLILLRYTLIPCLLTFTGLSISHLRVLVFIHSFFFFFFLWLLQLHLLHSVSASSEVLFINCSESTIMYWHKTKDDIAFCMKLNALGYLV